MTQFYVSKDGRMNPPPSARLRRCVQRDRVRVNCDGAHVRARHSDGNTGHILVWHGDGRFCGGHGVRLSLCSCVSCSVLFVWVCECVMQLFVGVCMCVGVLLIITKK